jgi:two-component sensor histidine kinase
VNLLSLFWSDEFMPHGHCFLWRTDLMSLHIVSDAVIAFSYYSIPFALIYFIVRRPDVQFRWIAVLFGIFIFACGTTHVLDIVVLWDPIYWIDGGVKAITALSSILTALLVWHIMPRALMIPSTGQLQDAVVNLAKEVASRRHAEEEVRSLNTVLESRVGERTLELEQSNAELKAAIQAKEVLLQEVHHRVKNNLQVASALLSMQAQAAAPGLRAHFQDSASRIEAMGRVHDQLHRAPDVAALDLGVYLRTLAGDLARIYGRADIATDFALPQSPVWIDFESANPLVLILNEALSNAYKHAFPMGRSGNVRISLDHGANGGASVTIADDGVGLSDTDTTHSEGGSIGMNLIRMLSNQIGATVHITGTKGTSFSLLLPPSIIAG